MEEERTDAMEMAKEKNAPSDETEKSRKEVMGVWGSQASWRAPVRVMSSGLTENDE